MKTSNGQAHAGQVLRPRSLGFALRLLGFFALVPAAQAQFVTVGPDPACSFSTLQDAVDAIPRGGQTSIRVVNDRNGFVSANLLIIDRNVSIFGGYDNCADTSADLARPSIIRSAGGSTPTVFITSFASAIPAQVRLENVRIEGGNAPFGAGLRISGANAVRLSSSVVSGNHASRFGGGVHLDGNQGASLRIEYGTRIEDNQADERGGGLSCVGGEVVFRDGRIGDNLAGLHGGGIYLDGCRLEGGGTGTRRIDANFVDASDEPYSAPFDEGVPAAGGGIYARASSRIELGNASSTTLLHDNDIRHRIYDGFGSHYTVDRGQGGALRLIGGSAAKLVNAHLRANRANEGGAVFASGGSVFTLERDAAGCPVVAGESGCVSLVGNRAVGYDNGFDFCASSANNYAGRGGALALRGPSRALLDGVQVRGNRVTQTEGCVDERYEQYPHGAAFDVRGNGITLEVFNSVVAGNVDVRADDLVHVRGDGSVFRAAHSTFVGNALVGGSDSLEALFRTAGPAPRIELLSSIVVEPGRALFANDGAASPALRVDCVLASSLSQFDDITDHRITRSSAGSAGFVDAATGDFRLAAGSAALDRCDLSELTARGIADRAARDLGGERRPWSGPGVATPWDLGAFERVQGTTPPQADLRLEFGDGGFAVPPGGSLGYLVAVRNAGPSPAQGLGWTADLDPAVGLPVAAVPFDARWNCQVQSRQVRCTWAERLNVGAATPQVAIQATAPLQPAALLSSAALDPSITYVDPVSTNDRATVATSIGLAAELRLLLGEAPRAPAGGRVRIALSVRNAGPDVAIEPRFSLTVPADFDQIDVESTPSTAWRCIEPQTEADGRRLIGCAATSLSPGDASFVFAARLPPAVAIGSRLPLDALITANGDGDDPDDNGLAFEVEVIAPAEAPARVFRDSFEQAPP